MPISKQTGKPTLKTIFYSVSSQSMMQSPVIYESGDVYAILFMFMFSCFQNYPREVMNRHSAISIVNCFGLEHRGSVPVGGTTSRPDLKSMQLPVQGGRSQALIGESDAEHFMWCRSPENLES
jgi:hypothetical protein